MLFLNKFVLIYFNLRKSTHVKNAEVAAVWASSPQLSRVGMTTKTKTTMKRIRKMMMARMKMKSTTMHPPLYLPVSLM